MRITFLLAAAVMMLCISCNSSTPITNTNDYSAYLVKGAIDDEAKKVTSEIEFWSHRLSKDTGGYINMLELARNYLGRFKVKGNVSDLNTGDSLLKRSSEKLAHTDPEILYALTQNSITQHQFQVADKFIQSAEKVKGDIYLLKLLQFDVNMELGRYQAAAKCLEGLGDKSAFDYLIRQAKWEDHKGNTDEAILQMEEALETVKDKKKSLFCWTLSNLGDMYGHAGRIKESYQAYLSVLKKDPSNLYCLKGIAWIAYSHDKNYREAKRILRYILSQAEMPELRIMLADIAASEDNRNEARQLTNEFISKVSKPAYGGMYNKYLIQLYCEELSDYDKALSMAKKELMNRFTPETCDLLAWAYYRKGELRKAYEYSSGHVYNFTFEPEALMHSGFIYADIGKTEEARKMLKQCLENEFELGPIAKKQIEVKLAALY
ncbi:MAG: hypothetical protein JNK27_08315 [Chitinophagaceae bacterium]|nr:hypothetical protein [Chitinophagaceae bacterium]